MNRKLMFLAAGIPAIGLMLLAGYRYSAGPHIPSDLRDAPAGGAMEALSGSAADGRGNVPEPVAADAYTPSEWGLDFGPTGFPEVIGCVTLNREHGYAVDGYFVLSAKKLPYNKAQGMVDPSKKSVNIPVLKGIANVPSDMFFAMRDANGTLSGFRGGWRTGYTSDQVLIEAKFNYVMDAKLPDYTEGITKRDIVRDMVDKGYAAAKLHYLEKKGGLLGHIMPYLDKGSPDFAKSVPIQCRVEKFEGLPYYSHSK